MELENYYYLLINAIAFVPVLFLSFDKKVAFWSHRKPLFISISIIGSLFIIWDIYFTHIGVWGFNERYLIGIDLFGIPIEEILFFVTIPYASIFTFKTIQQYFQESSLKNLGRLFLGGVFGFSFLILFIGFSNLYTGTIVKLSLVTSFLFLFLDSKWIGHFALTFILLLIPFLALNGILTGSLIENEIVWYNENEILGKRIGTIPIEDLFYAFLLLIWNIYFFGKFKKD